MVKRISLKSREGLELEMDEKMARQSSLLSSMLDFCTPVDPKEPVALEVDSPTLRRLVDWCKLKDGEANEELLKKEILETENGEQLVDLLQAANYLDIRSLVEAIAQKIANMASGRTVEQLRTLFGVQSDFDPDEEKLLLEKFHWINN